METRNVAPIVCHGHTRPVVDLFYSTITSDGIFLVSASKDGNPMVRQGRTGDWVGTFQGHKGAVWSCCFDIDAAYAATGSADFTAKVWDALTGDELLSFAHKHIVRACAFSEDTRLLLTGGFEKVLRTFDLTRPEAPPTKIIDQSPDRIRTVAWLHNGRTILSSCADVGGVRVWDVRSGRIVRTFQTASPVTSIEVSRDGESITTADGSSVKFWSPTQFQLLKSFDMPCTVASASLEPRHGNQFVAAGDDMWVHVLDSKTGKEITCGKGHHGPVHCVRFSPDGSSCASGSEDGTIRIWQMVRPSSAIDEPACSKSQGKSHCWRPE